MKKLINRQQFEADLADKWEHISSMNDEDAHRQTAVEAAMKEQQDGYKQLQLQERFLQKAWTICTRINADDPLSVLDRLSQTHHPETIGTL